MRKKPRGFFATLLELCRFLPLQITGLILVGPIVLFGFGLSYVIAFVVYLFHIPVQGSGSVLVLSFIIAFGLACFAIAKVTDYKLKQERTWEAPQRKKGKRPKAGGRVSKDDPSKEKLPWEQPPEKMPWDEG